MRAEKRCCTTAQVANNILLPYMRREQSTINTLYLLYSLLVLKLSNNISASSDPNTRYHINSPPLSFPLHLYSFLLLNSRSLCIYFLTYITFQDFAGSFDLAFEAGTKKILHLPGDTTSKPSSHSQSSWSPFQPWDLASS
jgi:hypothetical protein